jgi:hypothetical protein
VTDPRPPKFGLQSTKNQKGGPGQPWAAHTLRPQAAAVPRKLTPSTRRETVEHPFGTLKMRMGATHFLMRTLPKVATEMALHVLAYNLTRVMNIVGIKPLLAAIQA